MENINCNNCGKSNPTNFKYCASCGYELKKNNEEVLTETSQHPIESKRKLSIKTIIGIIVGFGTMLAVQQFFFKTPTYDKAMMAIASELNKTCPVMVDQETRLDNAIALPENIFQYNYTLVNNEKESINIDEIKQYIEPTIINFVKTNPQMSFQREHKTTINYYYKDKNGVFLFIISVTPDMYE